MKSLMRWKDYDIRLSLHRVIKKTELPILNILLLYLFICLIDLNILNKQYEVDSLIELFLSLSCPTYSASFFNHFS